MDTKVNLPECPHALLPNELANELGTNLQNGLKDHQVLSRVGQFGPNKLPDPNQKSPLQIFASQFKSTIVLILFIASAISYIYHHYLDVYIILGIILTNAIVGFIQEFQAERSLEALKNLIIPHIKVRRNGKESVVSSYELVPGDIIILTEGDHAPADGLLIQVNNFQTNESSLTGESLPINKSVTAIPSETPVAERTNMVWMGSTIVSGHAEAIVTATGTKTMLGSIAKSLRNIHEQEDHFKVKTDELARQMGFLAIASVILMFIVGYFIRKFHFEEIFIFSIASLVSAIPAGLPVILTIVLALSAKRMASRNAIVRRLSTTETLSVVDTIITDKTGTLTQNVMTVTAVRLPFQPQISISHHQHTVQFQQDQTTPTTKHYPLQKLLDIAGSCHNVSREYKQSGDEIFHGDPTEVALVSLADKASESPSYLLRDIVQSHDLPFNQEKRWRASVVEYQHQRASELFVIGSPETVTNACSAILLPDHQQHSITTDHHHHVHQQVKELSALGMRVIALAYRTHQQEEEVSHETINGLTFVGLVGIIDPPRPETKAAIASAHQAGISVIMATGDHPVTAQAIGQDLGIIFHTDPAKQVITETEFNSLSDAEVEARLPELRVFARMTPNAKLRLATILQRQGHVIAMTGDGVNDAPALKQADIGISMGKNGTDVAREASDIILADDNFATIISAIEEGRTQFRNIRRTSFFYITTNLAETFTLILFLFIGLPIPLLAKQILWLNLITGGVTDIALATEPSHEDVLTAPPRKKNEPILNQQVTPYLIIMVGTLIILCLIFFTLFLPQGLVKARTIVFAVISLTQLFCMYNLRSLKSSIFTIGFFSSRTINYAALLSLGLFLSVIYIPPLRQLFEFESLTLLELLLIFIASSIIFWASEAYKLIKTKLLVPTLTGSVKYLKTQ